MNCPEDVLIATFLYLERLDKLSGADQKINISNAQAKNVCDNIISIHKKQMSNIEKSLKQKQDLPYQLPKLSLSSKSVYSSINYIKQDDSYKNVVVDRTNKLSVETKYDLELDISVREITDNQLMSHIKSTEAKKIYLPNEDSIGYSLKDKLNTLVYIEDFLYSMPLYKENYSVIARHLYSYFAEDMQTDIITNNGKMATITKFTFSQNIIDRFVNSVKEEVDSNKFTFNEINLINVIRDQLNIKAKEDLLTIISTRSLGLIKFNDTLSMILDTKKNQDILAESARSETSNIHISFESIGMLNPVYSLSSKAGQNKMIQAEIYAYKKVYGDDLVTETDEETYPAKTIINLKSAMMNIKLDYQENNENEGIKLIRKPSEQAARDFFYHSKTIENSKGTVIAIDESDYGVKGEKAGVMREMVKQSSYVILATGTLLDGYPKNIAYQLAYLTEINDPKIFSAQLAQTYGNFKLRNTAIKNLLNAVRLEKYDAMFFSTAVDFHKSKENNYKIAQDFTNRFIKSIVEDDIVIGEIDYSQALQTFLYCFTQAKKISNYDKAFTFLKELTFVREGVHPLTKEEAGLQSVFSFIEAMGSVGANINVATREMIHGVKEINIFSDEKQYHSTKRKINSGDISISTIEENNESSALMFNAYYEHYARVNFVSTIKYLLQTNFEYFIKSLTDKGVTARLNFEVLQAEGGILSSMKRNEFIYSISETNKTTNNGVLEQYKRYLNANGDIRAIEDDKRKLVAELIEAFQVHCLDVLTNEKNENETDFVMLKTIFPEKISNNSGELILGTDLYFQDGYPFIVETELPIKFTQKIGFYKKEWEEFLAEPIEFNYVIGSSHNAEVMEVFASKGNSKQIDKDINNGYSPVIGSSRILSTAFNALDAIASAMRKNKVDKNIIQIQVVESSELKKILNKVDKTILMENDVELLVLPSKLINDEVKRVAARGIQSPFFTSIDAGARGLDFSLKGRRIEDSNRPNSREGIIRTTGTTVSPADLQQFLSRTFNPKISNRAETIMQNGGKDISIKAVSPQKNKDVVPIMDSVGDIIEGNINPNGIYVIDNNINTKNAKIKKVFETAMTTGVLVPALTFNGINTEKHKIAFDVSKEFMSGKRSDKKNTNYRDPISISDAFLALQNNKSVQNLIDKKNNNEMAI